MTSRVSGPHGVFVGLATLDVIHHVDRLPEPDEKVTAVAQLVAAGGPATNAAVTFAALGGTATLITAIGGGPLADLIKADLAQCRVEVVDLASASQQPSVSSIAVLRATGQRSVIGADSSTAIHRQPVDLAEHLDRADIILTDGHQPATVLAVATAARASGTPVVVDAGRWKPVFTDLIPLASAIICADDFRLPGLDQLSTARQLLDARVPLVALTAGGAPIRWWSTGSSGQVMPLPVTVVDTLGAGDALHGAYCYFRAADPHGDPAEHLRQAADIASLSCTEAGTRSWLTLISR